MPVYLRTRKGKAKSRYYLDIYHNGERWTESLDLYLVSSRNPIDTQSNKESKALAESIRAKRHLDLESATQDLKHVRKTTVRFVEYFRLWVGRYPNKDIRLAKACFAHFLKYLDKYEYNPNLTTRDITHEFAKGFKKYLEENLNGETPNNYFQKFIKLCNEATEEGLFRKSPTKGINNKRPEGLKKDILSMEEIARLREAECLHPEVRRAFMLSLNTGLRWVDVKKLCWGDIDGDMIRIIQSKTSRQVIVYLNKTAKAILQSRGKRDERVFTLPSTSYVTRVIRQWIANAGIDKHISFHCARHSFAVNALTRGTDVKTVSSLLGHTTIKHTEIYTRVIDDLKKKAVAGLDI